MTWVRMLIFVLLLRPLILLVLGLHLQNRYRLPIQGPAIVVANHNSHLDTIVLMSLFPLKLLASIRPVAAADYFMRNRLLAWLATRVMNILPISRHIKRGEAGDLFAPLSAALERGDVLILFPEGSRGEPERLSEFKNGIARLSERHPDIPVVPVFIHGLGKALPKGEFILVPFSCDIRVGEQVVFEKNRSHFMERLKLSMEQLANEGNLAPWE